MSTVGVRRIKERGGAGGKVTAALPNAKPLTPLSDKTKSFLSSGSINRTNGKEKPRSVSRGPAASHKPEMRPMPRIDKSSAAGLTRGNDEARRLLSSSSVPRGRSSSPSDFSRILSDMRRTRVSRVPVEKSGRVPVSEIGRSHMEMSALRVGNGKGLSGFKDLDKKDARESNLKVTEKHGVKLSAIRSSETADVSTLDCHSDKQKIEEDLSVCNNAVSKELIAIGPNLVGPDLQKARADLCRNGLKGMSVSKEKGGNAASISQHGSGNKNNSKLHEKLAFLEGKVKRIASDIKRTKEMLDKNNPDTSKVIISDIQEKISGIEKAMSHVVGESDRKSCLTNNMDKDSMDAKEEDFIRNEQVDAEKMSVKGLNRDALEERLLPHHKLLKGRTALKTSSSESQGEKFVLLNCESKSAHKPVGYSIDEDPIALEFLASINQQPSKLSTDISKESEVGEVQETENVSSSSVQRAFSMFDEKHDTKLTLTSDEQLDGFDEQENRPTMVAEEDKEDEITSQMHQIGGNISTAGWFVCAGESVLLAHDNGSCSIRDIVNNEEKSVYKPPSATSNIWRDCWIVRAASADGCSGKYVVAASAGNTLESGFCSWDFYTKEVQAFHIEERTVNKRSILAPLPNHSVKRTNTSSTLSTIITTGHRQWWYKPLGPLVVSTASSQRSVQIFDVRDGERIMKWDVQKSVLMMDNSSPLQWRNRGKVVIAEADGLTLWDVGSLNPRAVLSIPAHGHKISALHVCNTDAEIGGGVRQRITSSEAEGHDAVFCTADSINILDFRQPSGIGLKIPNPSATAQSIFSCGDSVFLGCNSVRAPGKKQFSSQVQHFSLRQQNLVSTYALPESSTSLNQVWGNSNLVMAVSDQGLYVFDAVRDAALQDSILQKPREVIGPNDMITPSFDHASSQVLLVSRDRPAMFRYI